MEFVRQAFVKAPRDLRKRETCGVDVLASRRNWH
jgi:hypothetical protein